MSKISIKSGSFGVEYDGADEFIKEGLLDLVADVFELLKTAPAIIEESIAPKPASTGNSPNFSVKTISAKLGNSKGSDLARAAAAFLTLVQNRETFSQAELLATMKTATGIFKELTHRKNIGQIVSGLMASNFLIETSTGLYTVEQGQRDQLAAVLTSG